MRHSLILFALLVANATAVCAQSVLPYSVTHNGEPINLREGLAEGFSGTLTIAVTEKKKFDKNGYEDLSLKLFLARGKRALSITNVSGENKFEANLEPLGRRAKGGDRIIAELYDAADDKEEKRVVITIPIN